MTNFNFNLTIKQAVHNAKILDRPFVIYTTDDQGNLGTISKFNLLGRFINYIKNLINRTGEHKVNKVVLATFETINQYAKDHPNAAFWTYPYENQMGKDFDVGFDKVTMKILMHNSRFEGDFYHSPENKDDRTRYKIREAAFEVLKMAVKEREKANIEFCCDHLPTLSDPEF